MTPRVTRQGLMSLFDNYKSVKTEKNFEAILRYCQPMISGYMYKRGKQLLTDPMYDHEDLEQEASIVLWQVVNSFDPEKNDNILQYLVLCLGRKLSDLRKKKHRYDRKMEKVKASYII